ncbi:hypothetical protein QMK33_19875 [Hymenobacter sp. H14-R3]|uniref:hypothetical protein n=1 Tax=Hymenobacter sp. H14-R3 TaxID=3046308 RepID=UPI0024BA7472|nr:hypothetical protein [Hymenobacter sp. H14-R3]MDJ0367413.1 hypothetical protein [Hymenobacter sp. H14-R3]
MKNALIIQFRHDAATGYYATAPDIGASVGMKNCSEAAKRRARQDLMAMAQQPRS